MHNTTGMPAPLGATPDETGVNFALSAPDAEKVELCLFDSDGVESRIALFPNTVRNVNGHDKIVWSAHVQGVQPGQHYGYRVHGEYAPEKGRRFNASKLLMDPYAKAIDGEITWTGAEMVHFAVNQKDSAPFMPRCRVVEPQAVAPASEKKPLVDYIIAETHVKGATIQHPGVPEELRGTYAGLASDAMIASLKEQGYNAVELLPVHTFTSDGLLEEKGLSNYWGYMTLGYLAPHAAYAATNRPEEEFAAMVKKLKNNGIDVIMDVVYNHTCEGNHEGPSLSIRGIDNYLYRLNPGDKSTYYDTTGCGNSLDFNHPDARELVLESLRHFTRMGVSGFRFDLGVALGREGYAGDFNPGSKLFREISSDPELRHVNLIWEPWDVMRPDSYQLGNMPRDASWNGKFRDEMREFWASQHGGDADRFTAYFTGSDGRSTASFPPEKRWGGFSAPGESINFVTAHDGSTLHDLVTYGTKNNWANQEGNRDGDENKHNGSGFDGETDDPTINRRRMNFKRALLTTTILSGGTPMIPLGHEKGKSQGGNTNTWCQDNPLSWNEWGDDLTPEQKELGEFAASVAGFRQRHAAFRRQSFLTGEMDSETGMKDFTRLYPNGAEIPHGTGVHGQAVALLYSGKNDRDIEDTPSLLLVNGAHGKVDFTLPALPPGYRWQEAIDTDSAPCTHSRRAKAGDGISVNGRSMVVFESQKMTQRRDVAARSR